MSAVSPAVTNGPSEQNGEGEQVWERPWSLEEIRKTSANWSLAADSGLFLFLQDFSQRMLSKTHEIEKQLDGLIRDTKATDCCLHTVFNDFLMLSNTQFIENRVYDEEVEEPVSKPEAVERPPEQEKTREQKEAELIPKVQEAVNYGLRVLESAFEQLDIKAGNSDSEDEEVADRVEPILEPKDLYVDRPLPYLIGSQHFMEQDDVGLGDLSSEEMSIDSDRDSVIDSDEDKNDDQSDYQSEEGQGSIKKKSSMASDEDEEEDDEEEDSDIFGDSDKDENEDGKSSTGPSSFADELAARIKGEVPHKPEEDRASLKSSASATKRKSKGKKEPKAAKPQVAPDNDDMFSPPKMEDEDYSPFGGKGGLFSGGRGLFDDDDEGDLFSDAPKQEQRVASPAPAAKDPVSSKSNKKIPTGAVSIFPEGSLFGSPANGSNSLEDRENGGPAKPRPAPKQAPKQAPVGGLFDDDGDDDDFFSGSTLKKSASAGHEKPKQKKAVDLFGGDGDDEDDGDGDIFGEASGVPPSKQSPKEEETAAPAPEKKMPAGAISMFGPGTKNVLVEGLKRRQHSTSEESEKAEENVPGGDVAKPSPKPAAKPQTRGLFSDDEDTQTKAEPAVQSKPSKALSIFDDEEEEDLFSSGPPKSKTNQAKSASVQKPSKPVSSGLFSDDEDQWMSSKPSEAKPDVKTGGMRGSNSAPSSLPSARAAQKDSPFDEEDHNLFTATKETSKKKSQRVSLLFEEEEEDEEGRGSLFGFQPPAPKSSAPDVKATDAEPPSRLDEEKEKEEDTQSSPQESVEPKKKPAGAVSLFGGIDVLGQKEEVAKPTKTPLEDPDKDDFLYRDSPPPMDEEPRAKKNVVSLFDNDDEDEGEEEEAVSVSSQPAAKNTLKDPEQKTRTKSTRVFQDEELLFTQKLQKDNDPDVDLFSTSVNPASLPPSSVKPGAPMLFGDEDEDDLFSSAKHKAPPKVAEKPRIEELHIKPVSLPVSGDAEKPTSPVKSKEPSSRIGKLQANLAISPAQLLPGAVPRMPGAVSVFPGLSPTSPSPPSFSSSSSSSSSALAQTPSPASSSAPQAGREGGVSFDGPAQVTTLQSTNKGRAKGAGRRRPQTRAARQLAAQEGQEEAGSGGAGAGGTGSGAAPLTDAPPNPSALRLPIFPPAETQGAKPKKPRPPATTAPTAAEEDLFASGDLFAPASKQTPSPKPKSASPEQAPSPALKKEDVPAIFDDPGGDLFQTAKHKPAKKPKAAAFLEEEDDDIFGGRKSTTVTLTKEPPAESNPSKQDIFQDEKQEAPKKRKGKALDASLFDDNVDIFADLTTTTKPKEKKSKKKVETKSIFDDDMDDIFSSGTVKPVVKPQSKSKKPQPSKDTTVAEETNHSIFDDPLNALGGN
ncbi:WASH complex subunit 2 isoform X2 [Conger conger]|uniref:WASH complex subunit 2 isoform X2 n=1 Tax=Conger conger TaxID=82655 RepID=UPI002A59930F|nr:WASH complex subunit 2 isoform X2 [Conger conger]